MCLEMGEQWERSSGQDQKENKLADHIRPYGSLYSTLNEMEDLSRGVTGSNPYV